MTFEQLLKTLRPSFWSMRGGGLRLKRVQRYLDEGGDPNARGDGGWTLLHHAAENGQPEVIRLLIARGANPNARLDVTGYTPLHLAIDVDCITATQEGRAPTELPTTQALIESGADESVQDSEGKLARDTAAAYSEAELYDAVSKSYRAQHNSS